MTEDDSTLGGYSTKHARPPAFTGSDGEAYSVELYVTEDDGTPCRYAGALLFVRWSHDGSQPVGHLETGYLAHSDSRADVKTSIGSLSLQEVKNHLDRLIREHHDGPDWP